MMRLSLVPVFTSIALVLAVSCVQVVNPTPQPTETHSGAGAAATQSPDIEVVPTPTVEISPTPTQVTPPTVVVSDNSEISIADLVERARKSVVRIDVTSADGTGTGTGFAYSENLILTNAHVVEGVENAVVSLRISEGVQPEEFNAVVLGRDENTDLAVLRVTAASFKSLELGNSSDAPVGTEVLAIGFPLGLDGDMSVTRGIVSRKLDSDGLNLVQHDAKILPGNSGGPLLTMDGTVVGINAAVVGDVSGKSGETLNFAIAIEEAARRLTSLENGSVDTATDRTFVSSIYGHSFDIPDGWFLIEESDESAYTYDEETQGFVSIQIDPDLSVFPSGQLWADYFYLAGVTYVDGDSYELIDEQITHNPDGSVEWYFLERFQRPGDDFMSLGGEIFTYDDGLGVRAYIEAPESTFEVAFAGMSEVLESFQSPTIQRPGVTPEIDRDCDTIDAEYAGFITNTTIGVTAPTGYLFAQSGCDLIGLLSIESEDLVGSGAFIGYLDNNQINFNVLGITNDAGVDIEFSGTVGYRGLIGTYTVPEREQAGVWDAESIEPYALVPTASPTPRPTSTPRPTLTPTTRPIPTPTPRPLSVDPNQDSWFIEGTLTHDPESNTIKTHSADVDLREFVAQTEFTNPFDGGWQSTDKWDYGFFFHKDSSSNGVFDAIVVRSDGRWEHRSGTSPPYDVIDSGHVNNLETGARQTNKLVLIVDDAEALFAVNDKHVATLLIGAGHRRGDVQVFTGFFTGDERTGAVTGFSRFRVQSLNSVSPLASSGEFTKEATTFNYRTVVCSQGGIIDVEFVNPSQSSSDAVWDYGIQIGQSGDYFDFVVVRANHKWEVRRRSGTAESTTTTASGSLPLNLLNIGNLAENHLRVTFTETTGWLSVNNRHIGSFDVGFSDNECHNVAAGFINGGTEVGAITKFKNVRLWSPYVDPNQGLEFISPTPVPTQVPSPTPNPPLISTPTGNDFAYEVSYDLNGGIADSNGIVHTQNRYPNFEIKVAPNQPLNQPPYVQLSVDAEADSTYSFSKELTGILQDGVWNYSYRFGFNEEPLPHSVEPDALYFDPTTVKWRVLVRAGNIGNVIESESEVYSLRIDWQIPSMLWATSQLANHSSLGLVTKISIFWDDSIWGRSLQTTDFKMKTNQAVYVPAQVRSGEPDSSVVDLYFDRMIDDTSSWTVLIQDYVSDLAGNSTDAGSVLVSK